MKKTEYKKKKRKQRLNLTLCIKHRCSVRTRTLLYFAPATKILDAE